MSAKQKMTIAITALCLVAVVAIVTVIAVFAASKQTFTSQVSVSYTVNDVQCTVSAKYYGGEGNSLTGEGTAMKDTDKVKTELKFGVESNDGTTLQPEGTIKLTSTDKVVIFEYVFKNDSSQHAFTAELKYTGTATNVTVRTNEAGSKLTPASDFVTDQLKTKFPTTKDVSDDPNFTTTQKIDVAENAEVHVYVRVEIADVSKDASFAGGFAWTLENAE